LRSAGIYDHIDADTAEADILRPIGIDGGRRSKAVDILLGETADMRTDIGAAGADIFIALIQQRGAARSAASEDGLSGTGNQGAVHDGGDRKTVDILRAAVAAGIGSDRRAYRGAAGLDNLQTAKNPDPVCQTIGVLLAAGNLGTGIHAAGEDYLEAAAADRRVQRRSPRISC
jgi:hypothetical protein